MLNFQSDDDKEDLESLMNKKPDPIKLSLNSNAFVNGS